MQNSSVSSIFANNQIAGSILFDDHIDCLINIPLISINSPPYVSMWSICGSSEPPLYNSINEQRLCESIVTQIMTFAAVMMVIMMMIVFICMGWLWRQFRIGGVGALRQIGRETQRWWAKRYSGQNSWQIETNWFCNKAKCQRRSSQAVLMSCASKAFSFLLMSTLFHYWPTSEWISWTAKL